MRIGILGTGVVGRTIGTRLIELGHTIRMGSRTADNPKGKEWVELTGGRGSLGTFADAASFGEIIFNCTNGSGALQALSLAGEKNLKGKILVDIANPLDFSRGMPPSLTVCNTDSLGEQIQKAFPGCKVVKTLNTVNCGIMIKPESLSEATSVFLCGNDQKAKQVVTQVLKEWFGWSSVIDLGDITGSRGMEMILPLWVRIMGTFGTPNFNFKIVQ